MIGCIITNIYSGKLFIESGSNGWLFLCLFGILVCFASLTYNILKVIGAL